MSFDDDDARSVLAALSYYAGRSLPSHLTGVAHGRGLTTGGWLYPQISPPIVSGNELPGQDLLSFGTSLRERASEAGMTMLTRADTGWPAETLGDQLPCLWVRGNSDLAGLLGSKAVTITGARACTAYGTHMTSQLTHDLVTAGCTVVTGASVGINARAAISALTSDKPAMVLIAASGLDHHYTDTTISGLVAQATQRSTVISAFPPGRTPSHASWELTDRLLGTVSAATVIVEAHPVSRSLRCAHAAADAGHAVGAVPGPITSGVSAGCHRLIADGVAQLVTHADIVTAISRPPGSHSTEELYQITAVAQWHDGRWRTRPVPAFAVRAASHAHAANTAFDVVFAEQYDAAALTVGVMDPRGVYQDVNVDVRRAGATASSLSTSPVTDGGPPVSATPI